MIASKLIASTVAGAAFGAGTLALAPSDAAAPAAASSDAAARAWVARHPNVIHGNWVTRNRVRHEAIRGVVRTVNSKFITVRAVDGFTQTYRVTRDTKVRVRGDGHASPDAIGDVKVGYRTLVVGVGNDLATRVVARKPKPSTTG